MPSRARITAFLSLALSAVTLSAGLFVAATEAGTPLEDQTSSQVNAAMSVTTSDTGWG